MSVEELLLNRIVTVAEGGTIIIALIFGIIKLKKALVTHLDEKIENPETGLNAKLAQAVKRLEEKADAGRKDVCKDIKGVREEIIELRTDFREHINDTKPMIDEHKEMVANVKTIVKSIERHDHQIEKIQDEFR